MLFQLSYIIGHINLDDKTGKLILISLSYLQLISGSHDMVLNKQYQLYQGWIEPGWLTNVWEFLSKMKITIHLSQAWVPQKTTKSRSHLDESIHQPRVFCSSIKDAESMQNLYTSDISLRYHMCRWKADYSAV